MKKFVYEMETEKVIDYLKQGKVIKDNITGDTIYMLNDMLCHKYPDGDVSINCTLDCFDQNLYFKIDEPFEIKELGIYKTRDGRRAFVSCINNDNVFNVTGIIEGYNDKSTWTSNGRYNVYDGDDCCTDIVSKWED